MKNDNEGIGKIYKGLGRKGSKLQEAAPPIRSSLQLKAREDRNIKLIAKKDELPAYISVLTATGAPFELSPELQRHYAVLLINAERKEVIIVSSLETEVDGEGAPDIEYMSIMQTILREGYIRRNRLFADEEIISIIYESVSSKMTTEERNRSKTKIQLDFDDLLRSALHHNATDIHIEVRRLSAKIRLRRNGDLFDFKEWPVAYARTMAGVIYQVIADEKDTSFDESRPQDALIDRDLGEGLQLRVRLATLPAYPSGFDMIMRVLRMGQDGTRQSLDQLGYEKQHLTSIRRAVSKPVGAVIMAGTTGSGKSTSLNSMLGEKIDQYRGTIKVITVEDPPEYALPGASQVPVVRRNNQTGNPFAPIVRAAMRSDPDILMVGEVRDEASAELLVHAVQSGHQVFTTVHAGSAIDIVSRLRSNGIPDDVLGGQNFISGLMFQTLVPILCKKCSNSLETFSRQVSSDHDEDLMIRIKRYIDPGMYHTLRFENAAGCDECTNGRTGRSVASEVILPDAYMLSCFRNRQDSDAFMHYRRRGGKIALEHGLIKVFRGEVDIRMVESKLDQIALLDELHIAMMLHEKIDHKEGDYQIGKDVMTERNRLKGEAIDASDKVDVKNTAQDTEVLVKQSVAPAPAPEGSPAPQAVASPKSNLLGDTKKNNPAPVIRMKKKNDNEDQTQ